MLTCESQGGKVKKWNVIRWEGEGQRVYAEVEAGNISI